MGKAEHYGLIQGRVLSSPYTYSHSYTASPTPGPTPAGQTVKNAITGTLTMSVPLTSGTVAQFVADTTVQNAVKTQLASVTGLPASSITVTGATRRLLSGGRRLAETASFTYTI